MISKFFIDRPVFAAVISIVIVLAGLMSMRALPIAQYPEIVPPEISVSTNYPGASAQIVAETVAAPLEQQINGVENMLYMTSTTTASGALSMTVTFQIGTNPDQAQINVNNRVQAALSTLPSEVQRQGVQVRKRSSSILQVATMSSTNPLYDTIYVSNYALVNVIDELKRVPGVGDASLFGQKDYAMRIWLRPDKLAQFDLTPADVTAAIREQNSQFAAGQFGQEPMEEKGAFTYSVTTPGRLVQPKEFEAIVLRSNSDGATLRLGDVARVELGGADYSFSATANGRPAIAIGLYLQPGANALSTANAVQAKLKQLSAGFPSGIEYAVPFDTTRFVQISIQEVIRTFVEALVLVVLVVFLFLQNWRATIIPLIAVPISLVGTFAGMYLLGFSINLLTLFGMILAIGIVVDDAIVVLENVERIMRTERKSPHDAAVQAMLEVSGPVIAIVLVLCAVFVPVGFLGGLAGQMYKQFAITIAVSVVISGIVALTLTPALCALLLKESHHEPMRPFRIFNRAFDRLTSGFAAGVAFFLRRVIVGLAVFAAVVAATVLLYNRVPGSLVPNEDQGYVFVIPMLPPAASLARTAAVTKQMDDIIGKHPAVQDTTTFAGFDLLTGGSKTYAGVSFVTLKDWSQRTDPALDARNLPGAFMGMTAGIHDALVVALNPPPISGISTTGGFEMFLQDRTGAGGQSLGTAVQSLLAAAAKRPELTGLQTTFNSAVPQYRLTLDRAKAKSLDVPIDTVFSTMQSTFGNYYVNDFTLMGRNYKVTLQSESQFREKPADLRYVLVRSTSGNMIPLDSLLTTERIVAPDTVQRFNLFPAAKVMGNPAPGFSSGQALAAMEQVAAETLSADYSVSWTGSAYQERSSASTAGLAYIFGIVMVFLILAAQYEKWSLPLAVITAVPFAILGALVAVWLRGLSNDVYFQVGLLTLIGLSAKNAILIVEFAVMRRAEGLSAFDAAMEAAKLRFRPIVMTSLAFILGVVPLVISTGAGSASRRSIGTGVVGGMLAATFIAIFLVPMFYEIVTKLTDRRKKE